MKTLVLYICLTSLLNWTFTLAPCQQTPGKELKVLKTNELISIDGELSEEAWQKAQLANNFYQNYPNDSLPASNQTEAKITFDNHYLYVAFKCFAEKPVAQNMRRDFPDWLNDMVFINIGGFDDNVNANWFGVSYPGVQYDGAISNGGETDDGYNGFWDAKWYTKTKSYDGYWTAELAIPFKSFRYSNKLHWDINFLRMDALANQTSHWIRVPVQYMVGSQAFQGKIVPDEPLPAPGKNIVLIPYGAFEASEDKEMGLGKTQSWNAGFDAKVGITPQLNLDLTLNPDFSHVEVDQQMINLTRFEFNFPERRQFFLDNSDLFGQLGLPLSRPFFTRRIGLAQDSSGLLQKVPILYGMRLSGKLGKTWRIGAMNLSTGKKAALGLPVQNYSMAVAQYRILSRSFFSGFFINKQSVGLSEYSTDGYYHSDLLHENPFETPQRYSLITYNRLAGAEFNLLTSNNKWSGKIFYHRSFDHFHKGKNSSYGMSGEYNIRRFGIRLIQQNVEKDFRAETGYVPGLAVYPGFNNTTIRSRMSFYPKNSRVVKAEPYLETNFNLVSAKNLTDHSLLAGGQVFFVNSAILKAELRNWYQKLPVDFNPISPKGDSMLLTGQSFKWKEYEIQFQSDPRKKVSYTLGSGGGQFYNGNRQTVFGEVVFRIPPYVTFSSLFNYTFIELPEIYGKTKFALISPKLDITFTPNIFLTAFIQYNTRYENVNLNARFQWRFKPVSDFFIVYTENYLPGSLSSRNHSLVFKITYWLNM